MNMAFQVDAQRRTGGAGAGQPVDDPCTITEYQANALMSGFAVIDRIAVVKIVGSLDRRAVRPACRTRPVALARSAVDQLIRPCRIGRDVVPALVVMATILLPVFCGDLFQAAALGQPAG